MTLGKNINTECKGKRRAEQQQNKWYPKNLDKMMLGKNINTECKGKRRAEERFCTVPLRFRPQATYCQIIL